MPPLRLRHYHLASPAHPPYSHASYIQSLLVSRLLAHKSSPETTPPLPPTLLTFSPSPIYTTGRREATNITPDQLSTLTAPLHSPSASQTADFAALPRGGLLTFHGPGQLVAYPILDLHHPTLKSTPFSPSAFIGTRTYICLLEKTTIALLKHFGIASKTTENPGVWVNDDQKIAAVGVHLRRYVTSFGTALNVTTDLRWFERIVACGLVGKGMCSMESVAGDKLAGSVLTVEEVGRVWAKELADRLGAQVEHVARGWELFEEGSGEREELRKAEGVLEEDGGTGK